METGNLKNQINNHIAVRYIIVSGGATFIEDFVATFRLSCPWVDRHDTSKYLECITEDHKVWIDREGGVIRGLTFKNDLLVAAVDEAVQQYRRVLEGKIKEYKLLAEQYHALNSRLCKCEKQKRCNRCLDLKDAERKMKAMFNGTMI